MLLNLSNHPLRNWEKEQTETAQEQFGAAADMPFPNILPTANEKEIERLSEIYLNKIIEKLLGYPEQNNAVHIMGELTFTFNLVNKLIEKDIVCIASTTERKSLEENGKKISEFKFVEFRKYKI